MAFRVQGNKDLQCVDENCKLCAWEPFFLEARIYTRWNKAIRKAIGEFVPFAFYSSSRDEWYRIPVRFSDINLVHVWDMYETHGLTALYREHKQTLGDVVNMSDQELLAIWGFGERSLREVCRLRTELSIIRSTKAA